MVLNTISRYFFYGKIIYGIFYGESLYVAECINAIIAAWNEKIGYIFYYYKSKLLSTNFLSRFHSAMREINHNCMYSKINI